MSRLILAILSIGFLSACGADGEPEQPSMNAAFVVSGNGGSYGGVGLHQGPISQYLGFYQAFRSGDSQSLRWLS